MKTTKDRVDYLYDLMDAAYEVQPIYEVSRTLDHVPIIDKNSRGRDIIPLAPMRRYAIGEGVWPSDSMVG